MKGCRPGAAVAITGPWEVSFDPGWGAPAKVTIDKLESWSKHPEDGMRYFSGGVTANYSDILPCRPSARRSRVYLDLGKVASHGGSETQRQEPRHPLEAAVPRRCHGGHQETATTRSKSRS